MFPNYDDVNKEDRSGIEYLDALYGYAFVLTGTRADAEDLVEKTYLQTARIMQKPAADIRVKWCLFKRLRGLWLRWLSEKQADLGFVEIRIDTVKFDDDSPAAIEGDQVRTAIERLPLKFREVIYLREFGELTYEEIADVLNYSEEAVLLYLGKARRRLRQMLAATLAM